MARPLHVTFAPRALDVPSELEDLLENLVEDVLALLLPLVSLRLLPPSARRLCEAL